LPGGPDTLLANATRAELSGATVSAVYRFDVKTGTPIAARAVATGASLLPYSVVGWLELPSLYWSSSMAREPDDNGICGGDPIARDFKLPLDLYTGFCLSSKKMSAKQGGDAR
jgi:hypothetical protein